jgi:pimeloyl-ACP methyl ester carboxylesterase
VRPFVPLGRATFRAGAAALLAMAGLFATGVGIGEPLAHSCVSGDERWFRAADGTRLVGHRFGGPRAGGRTAVVLAHMSDGDLCAWAPYARVLARNGLFAFAFDFRGHGFSQGRSRYGRLPADATAAVREVRRLGARRVVLVGASLGGIAALAAAPGIRPALAGVVAVSAPAAIEGRLDARPAVRRLDVPTLYLVAEDDRNAAYDFAADARALHAATATEEKRLLVLPGSAHGTALVAGSARARSELLRFVRDSAGAVR